MLALDTPKYLQYIVTIKPAFCVKYRHLFMFSYLHRSPRIPEIWNAGCQLLHLTLQSSMLTPIPSDPILDTDNAN